MRNVLDYDCALQLYIDFSLIKFSCMRCKPTFNLIFNNEFI